MRLQKRGWFFPIEADYFLLYDSVVHWSMYGAYQAPVEAVHSPFDLKTYVL